MTQAVYERTPNLGLGLIEFNFPNWADDANLNMTIIDAAMRVIGVSVTGGWTNDTSYQVGQLLVDTDLNSLWRVVQAHTSAPTGTFAQDRLAHPGYWEDAAYALHARGQWMPSTAYYTNDVVYNGYTWALVTRQHVSGPSFNQDVADGELVIIMDGTATVDDSEAAANVAMNAADTATAAATTATTNANLATGAASAASASQAAAASSASASAASAAAAATSAANADYLYNHMLPDAPKDGKYYGRFNETWTAVIAEAPNDGVLYGRQSGSWVPSSGCIVSDNAPTVRWNGMLWYESDTGNTYMWYVDPNSSQWLQISGFAAYSFGAGGGIAEAPIDGHTYARRDTAWVDMGGAVPVNEAPNDGKMYVRKNTGWVELPAIPTFPMVFDTNGDAVIKFGSTIVVRIKATGLILTKDDVEVFSTSV